MVHPVKPIGLGVGKRKPALIDPSLKWLRQRFGKRV